MKVLFFAESRKSLGHARRSVLLAEAMYAIEPSTVIRIAVTSPVTDVFKERGFRIIPLAPRAEEGVTSDGRLPSSYYLLLKNLITNEKPDAFVLDSFYSMQLFKDPALHMVRILVLRKYRNEDMIVFLQNQVYANFSKVIVVHSRLEFKAFENDFKEALDKLLFVGPIVAESIMKRKSWKGTRILATCGGGALPEHKGFVDICIGVQRQMQLPMTLVTGPLFEGFEGVKAREAEGLRVLRAADVPSLLTQCDVAITQAGYNTINDLIQTRTPAVIIPLTNRQNDDQPARARWLASFGVAKVIETPDAKKIATAVQELANISREEWERRFSKIPFVPGTKKAAELIMNACTKNTQATH